MSNRWGIARSSCITDFYTFVQYRIGRVLLKRKQPPVVKGCCNGRACNLDDGHPSQGDDMVPDTFFLPAEWRGGGYELAFL
jgi:hypothetical protein